MSTRHHQPLRFSVTVFGVVLAGGLSASADPAQPSVAADQVAFDRFEVVTGLAERQSILTGFLSAGAMAVLAVVDFDENDERRLRIFAFGDGTWAPKLKVTLRREVLFVDVANIGGRDRLLTYEPGRLSWFDPESATVRPLVSVTSSFTPPRKDEIPQVDITQDVNDDGRDDLVVPAVDGFQVFIQAGDGIFARPMKIGPPADLSRIYGADGYRFDPWSQSRVHQIDFNHDGRGDLVFWNKNHFMVHLQDEGGLFAPETITFTTDVAFDSDNLSSLATGDMTGRVLHSLADLNGDGVGDLVILSLEGRRISRKLSRCEVHFGARTPGGGIAFAPEVGVTFQSEDSIMLGMDRHDFDGDGQPDLMFTTIQRRFLEGSLWKRLKGFMGDDVWLNLEFYRLEEGRYPDTPGTTRRIALDGAPSHREPGSVPLDLVLRGATHEQRKTENLWPRAFNRTLLVGDVTGDGRLDLLIEPEFRELQIFAGVPGPAVLAPQSQKVAVRLHDGEYAWLADLNKDGKQDILVHHPFTQRDVHGGRIQPPGTEPHRLTVLIAQ